jgi:DNA (cytosine-5)-methyltransferase 1
MICLPALRYISVCSGIEAATVAWEPLGWIAVAYAEIDKFARAVLAHHYPKVPLHGDFTTIEEDDYGSIDLLVGGTPCQDFSIAGLRAGIAGDRGNITLQFLRLVERKKPRWIVWENVPGVLSSDGGRALGAFLGGLAELGYGFAYRVLDAQYFGLAQRRARVFVVGYLGDWRPAAAVLLEPESLQSDPPPRREARERIAPTVTAGSSGRGPGVAYGGNRYSGPIDVATTLQSNGSPSGRIDFESETFAVNAFDARQSDVIHYGDKTGPLDTSGNSIGVLCVDETQITNPTNRSQPRPGMPSHPLAASALPPTIATNVVRRLTPRECERLQGFPDDYTLIQYRGKPAKDGPRYKALGNSMAVPVMRWIGERIAMVEAIINEGKER